MRRLCPCLLDTNRDKKVDLFSAAAIMSAQKKGSFYPCSSRAINPLNANFLCFFFKLCISSRVGARPFTKYSTVHQKRSIGSGPPKRVQNRKRHY